MDWNGENNNKKSDGKKRGFIKKHPFAAAVLFSLGAGMSMALVVQTGMIGVYIMGGNPLSAIAELFGAALSGMWIYGGFILFPLVLTGVEIYLLIKGRKDQEVYQKCRIFDVVGILLGVFYSLMYLSLFREVLFHADWQEQLVNGQTHTPVYTGAQFSVIAIAAVAVAGYLVVNYIPLAKMPPLVLVLGMAAMYLGAAETVVWGVQVFVGDLSDVLLLLFPFNCLVLTARIHFTND